MVSFRNFATIAFAAVAMAHYTPEEVVSHIDLLTQKCETLQGIAHGVSIVHGVLGSGPVPHVLAGLHEIVSTVTYDLHHMEGMPAVEDGPDSEAISEAFHHFALEHEKLASIMALKSRVFQIVPSVLQEIFEILQEEEAVLDHLVSNLFHIVPIVLSKVEASAILITGPLHHAIESYEAPQAYKRAVGGSLRARAVVVI